MGRAETANQLDLRELKTRNATVTGDESREWVYYGT
jgi:hypothetical protein